MKIIINNNGRILLKDNNDIININDKQIIQYTGNYYKNIDNNIDITEMEFIGIVETHKYNINTNITGIYVRPLYIWYDDEWNKIINFKPPEHKYFFYPHLLMLPGHNYVYCPQYFLHTCENRLLDDFANVIKTFDLQSSIVFT